MAVGLLAFFQLGLIQAAYGPSFIALQARHGIGVAEVGATVGLSFFGGIFGILLSGVLLLRFGYGVVVLYNSLFARAFAPRGAAAVNLVNAMFGVGAILMPSVVALITAWQVGLDPARVVMVPPYAFSVVAAAGVTVIFFLWRLPWWPAKPLPSQAARGLVGVPLLSAGLLAGVLLVYVAGEVSIAAWAPTHLESLVGAAQAALVVSLFWATMTVGRFGVAFFGGRLPPAPLVLGSVALVLAAGNIGPVISAPAIGLVIAASGPEAVPSVLAAVLALLLVVALAAWLDARRAAL